MSSGLDNAIEKLYVAFANEAKPAAVDACKCCIGEHELNNLIKIPLRQLTSEQLSNYASSVFLTAGSEKDFRYFIPRILDLSLHGQFGWPDHEVICKSLANGGWLSWPETLKASIVNVFSAAWEEVITSDDEYNGDELIRGFGNADELICGFGIAGIDVRPFLDRLEAKDAEETLISLYERNSDSLMKGKLSNAFWGDHKAEAAPIIEWFKSDKITGIINRHYGIT